MVETDLMHRIMEAVSKRGCLVFRSNVGKVRTPDGRWFDTGLPKGFPDLFGFLPRSGRIFFIECKVKPNKPTPEQVNFLHVARSLGAIAFVAYSIEEVEHALDDAAWADFGLAIQDPYEDESDTELWMKLFCWASTMKRELYECLQTIRREGAKLIPDPKYGLRIIPGEDKAHYKNGSQVLYKYRYELIDELAWLAKRRS
jgi:hypothetical protein